MGLKIDKGVPLPPHPKYFTGEMQAVIEQMEVGDSVFVACPNPVSRTAMMHKCALRAGVKVTTRRVEENGEKGVRVWRVE